MIINDFLYGKYEVNDWILPLVHSPVVQRLRWVSLSNIPSISYPMIAGVSRYAHSLGVSILADKVSDSLKLDLESKKELMTAGLLHDAGMPPLGHLTEEAITDLGETFDHEDSLNLVIFGEGRRFITMPNGQKINLTETLNKANVNSENVFNMILGKGDLGSLISSRMDLDNLDNIVRMYRLISSNDVGYNPSEVACDYFASDKDKIEIFDTWMKTRINLYNKLMFSIPDFSQKAYKQKLGARF